MGMVLRMLSRRLVRKRRMIWYSRHRLLSFVRAGACSVGGKKLFLRHRFAQGSDQQLAVEPCLHGIRVGSRRLSEAEKALQPAEHLLNLPTGAVQFQNLSGRIGKAGCQDDIARHLLRLWLGRIPPLAAGRFGQPPVCSLRCGVILARRHDAHRVQHAFAVPVKAIQRPPLPRP